MENTVLSENQKAWEQASEYHQKSYKLDYKSYFKSDNNTLLNSLEEEYFKNTELSNKTVAHLCCNNGKEIFSLVNMGVKEIWGFDFNKIVIDEANETKNYIGKDNVYFVECEVTEIKENYYKKFDIVFINVGTIGWFPNQKIFFQKVFEILKDGGEMYMCDIHPICDILNDDRDENKSPLEVTGNYLEKKAFWNKNGFDYIGGENYNAVKSNWHTYTLSEVINSIASTGMKIEFLNEKKEDISGVYPILENSQIGLPLSFELLCRK